MGGMYSIICKKEYFSTWPQELKNGLDDFATVWVVDFADMAIYDEYHIYSPSKKYSIAIDTTTTIEDYEILVYIVSDGGYLFLWGCFSDDKTILNILIQNWEIVDDKIFYEMYGHTTSILEKMMETNFSVPPSMTVTQKMICFLLIFLFSLIVAICMVIFGVA